MDDDPSLACEVALPPLPNPDPTGDTGAPLQNPGPTRESLNAPAVKRRKNDDEAKKRERMAADQDKQQKKQQMAAEQQLKKAALEEKKQQRAAAQDLKKEQKAAQAAAQKEKQQRMAAQAAAANAAWWDRYKTSDAPTSGESSSMGEMTAPGHDTNETAKPDNEFASNEMSEMAARGQMPFLDELPQSHVKAEPNAELDAEVAEDVY